MSIKTKVMHIMKVAVAGPEGESPFYGWIRRERAYMPLRRKGGPLVQAPCNPRTAGKLSTDATLSSAAILQLLCLSVRLCLLLCIIPVHGRGPLVHVASTAHHVDCCCQHVRQCIARRCIVSLSLETACHPSFVELHLKLSDAHLALASTADLQEPFGAC